jgi:ABC-type glycerol-3-phosphate transport system substrate-binding protein
MKIGKLALIVMGFVIILTLAACSSQAQPPADSPQPVVDATLSTGGSVPVDTVAPGAGSQPATVDAMALIQEKLQNHHGIDWILNAKHTREEWNATLDRMIKYGANISEDEKKIIIDYLLSR